MKFLEMLYMALKIYQGISNITIYSKCILLGEFQGDIAIPFIERIPEHKRNSTKLQEEIEKYKQEILEGLQVEEDGLTEYIRKKSKQDLANPYSKKYNDPNRDILINTDDNTKTLKSYTILNKNKIDHKGDEFKEVKIPENNNKNVTSSSNIKNHKKSFIQYNKVITKDRINPTR